MNELSQITNKTIFRKAHNRENPYAQISKSVLRDNRLSAKAMGIMCYLLGLPDHWRICNAELTSHFRDGRDSISAGIIELISLGYIERKQTRLPSGHFSPVEMLVHEEPHKPSGDLDSILSPVTDLPLTGFPQTVKPDTGNPHLVNTDILKTDLKETNKQSVVVFEDVDIFEKYKVKQETLDTWLVTYGKEMISQKIKMLENEIKKGEVIVSPGGWINKALIKNYGPSVTNIKPISTLPLRETEGFDQRYEKMITESKTSKSREAGMKALKQLRGRR